MKASSVSRSGNPHLHFIRHDQNSAANILSVLFPTASAFHRVLEILAEDIRRASRLAPASWGVSLFPNMVRLNVGGLAVLHLYSEQILFSVTGKLFKSIPKRDQRLFEFNRSYRFVPDADEGWLSSGHLDRFSSFSNAHADLVERCAQRRKLCFWLHAHSPSVTELLHLHGHNIPEPDYQIANSQTSVNDLPDSDEEDHSTVEGRRILRTHLAVERDPKISQRKKELVLKQTGELSCEVCNFNFESTYGSIGHYFAEVHHVKPFSSSKTSRNTRITDLAIVCSNCHRMLHRGNPVLSLEELKARLVADKPTRKH